MLDDKTIKLFGDTAAFEYKLGLSPINFDAKRGLLLHNGSYLQRLLFALNLLHLLGYLSFEGISLCSSLTGDRNPSDVFWFLLYFCVYLWALLSSLDAWIRRDTVAQAFNSIVNLAKTCFKGNDDFPFYQSESRTFASIKHLLMHLKER
jgi:hypothetical protein